MSTVLGGTLDLPVRQELLEMDPVTFKETPVAAWRPAILVRFPLQIRDAANLFEVTGR